ncbi:MAG: hypothetical protein QCH96_05880 [Candidatus Thermoplasmatota archaeon]|nr:hypothetical protein [Candidatus Thermoplasmatota archaeon]
MKIPKSKGVASLFTIRHYLPSLISIEKGNRSSIESENRSVTDTSRYQSI